MTLKHAYVALRLAMALLLAFGAGQAVVAIHDVYTNMKATFSSPLAPPEPKVEHL